MRWSLLAIATPVFAIATTPEFARPADTIGDATRLASEPNLWLARGFISSPAAEALLARVPKEESAYAPCIGQVEEFSHKKFPPQEPCFLWRVTRPLKRW